MLVHRDYWCPTCGQHFSCSYTTGRVIFPKALPSMQDALVSYNKRRDAHRCNPEQIKVWEALEWNK